MRTLLIIAVSFGLAACAESSPEADASAQVPAGEATRDHQFDDPEVTRIHSRMMDEMAPDNGWDRARYIEFDWGVNREGGALIRSHRWDRFEGTARYEADSEDGRLVAIFPTDTPEDGRVWVDGEELEGDAADQRLQGAYRAHINDSYWLLMPYKWSDPGVTARYLGTETDDDGQDWEVVELTFEQDTGLTPQNMYHAFINPETGLMERWHHYSNADSDPSPTDWTAWTRVGPIMLARDRESNGEVRLFFSQLDVREDVPEGAFDPPA